MGFKAFYLQNIRPLLLLPTTSALVDAPQLRFKVDPSSANGLRRPSQIMIDKAVTVVRAKGGAFRSSVREYDAGGRSARGFILGACEIGEGLSARGLRKSPVQKEEAPR
jgi:hypothetical protein